MTDSVSNELPSIASVIQQAVLNKLKEVHTMMPGIIVSFDAEKQTAEVQPAIKRVFILKDGNKDILTPTDLPKLINVPVVFPRGGGFSLTFPIAVGDECLIKFQERDIDNWQQKGDIQPPHSFRQHSLSDAICFVGIASEPKKITDFDDTNVVLRDEAGTTRVRITPTEKVQIDAVEDVEITAKKLIVDASVKVEVEAPAMSFTIDNQIDITCPLTLWDGDIYQTGYFSHLGDYGLIGNYIQIGNKSVTGATTLAGPVAMTPGSGEAVEIEGDIEQVGDFTHEGDTDITGDVVHEGDLAVEGDIDVDSGDITVTSGDVDADGVTMKTHVHPVVQPNGTPTGVGQ